MKKINFLLFIVSTFISFFMAPAMAQEDDVDKIIVNLTDPSKPVYINLNLVNGGITVIGTKEQIVTVEAKTVLKKIGINPELLSDQAGHA